MVFSDSNNIFKNFVYVSCFKIDYVMAIRDLNKFSYYYRLVAAAFFFLFFHFARCFLFSMYSFTVVNRIFNSISS